MKRESVVSKPHLPCQCRQNDSVSTSNFCHRLESGIIFCLELIGVRLLILGSIKGTLNLIGTYSHFFYELLK